MAISTSLTPTPSSNGMSENDVPTWDGLKRAIISSSGFQRWCLESDRSTQHDGKPHDENVMAYLRETLETLAY